jgi:hypothetical protein
MANLLSTLRSLIREKISVTRRENELLSTLNRVLPSIGYKIVRTEANGAGGSASRESSAPRPLACPHCDRRFAQPLHLGRHVSAMHKSERQGAARPTAARRRAVARSIRRTKKAA